MTLSPLLIKLLGIAGAILVVAGGAFYAGHHSEAKAFQDYKDQQAAAGGAQVVHNTVAVAAITASEAQGLRDIAAAAQESRNEIQKRNDALVGSNAALADTVGKLQHRLAVTSGQPVVVPGPAAGGPIADAAGDAALSVGLADLVKFTSARFLEADSNAVTITGLQAVVKQDRQICNGALPGLN